MTEATENKELVLSPTEAAMLQAMRQGSGKSKKGLGLMWGSSTEAIGEVFGTITVLARSGRVLAEQAEDHALLGRTESSQELLAAYNIEATGYEAVLAAKQLKKLLLSA
jgi:hypothetical protein